MKHFIYFYVEQYFNGNFLVVPFVFLNGIGLGDFLRNKIRTYKEEEKRRRKKYLDVMFETDKREHKTEKEAYSLSVLLIVCLIFYIVAKLTIL